MKVYIAYLTLKYRVKNNLVAETYLIGVYSSFDRAQLELDDTFNHFNSNVLFEDLEGHITIKEIDK